MNGAPLLPFLFALHLLLASAGAESFSALAAVKVLPKEAAARVARINGFDGAPTPKRWHILTHDPKAENGLREYVVASGEIVASRTVSQFADELKPEDVLGADAVRVDTDAAIKTAQHYAQANKLMIATYNIELRKDGEAAAPLWRLTCLDAKGGEIGLIQISAGKGKVVTHDGFPVEPKMEGDSKPEPKSEPKSEPKPKAESKTESKTEPKPEPKSETKTEPKPESKPESKTEEKPKTAAAKEPKKPEVRKAQPAASPAAKNEERPGFFQRAGGSIRNIFSGRETRD